MTSGEDRSIQMPVEGEHPVETVSNAAENESPAEIVDEANAAVLIAIDRLEETLGNRLDALRKAIDRDVRAEATREKVVDRLHAELQEYKNDLLLSLMRPVFMDLIQLHDDIGKTMTDDARDQTTHDIRQAIEDILYRQGVESFTTEDDVFDPRRQRASSAVATDDPLLAKRVASRLRSGFRSGDKILRPEIVSVYALPR